MKKGRIILGAAAFIVTAGSAFALKATNFSGHQRLYGATSAGSSNCTLSTCVTFSTGRDVSACKTAVQKLKSVFTGGHQTLWTSRTTVNNKKCQHPNRSWTSAK